MQPNQNPTCNVIENLPKIKTISKYGEVFPQKMDL
jgi:hypothetical protein